MSSKIGRYMERVIDRRLEYEKDIVREYLTYGSVDAVLRETQFSLPFSFAEIHRILDRWGVVKSAGPNTPIAESIGFFVRLIEERVPLEDLYKRTPPNFATSVATLHRIYRWAKEEIKKEVQKRDMRRAGTALVVSPFGTPNLFVIARDVTPAKHEFKKLCGSVSFPMTFSKRGEARQTSVLRVLQQEVFSDRLIEDPNSFYTVVSPLVAGVSPFMFLDIADVRVAVYHVELPNELSGVGELSSPKLKDFKFVTVKQLKAMSEQKYSLRQGMLEIAGGYRKYLSCFAKGEQFAPIFETSLLNQKMAFVASEAA